MMHDALRQGLAAAPQTPLEAFHPDMVLHTRPGAGFPHLEQEEGRLVRAGTQTQSVCFRWMGAGCAPIQEMSLKAASHEGRTALAGSSARGGRHDRDCRIGSGMSGESGEGN